MARNQKDGSFDYELRLKDAGLITADAAATVGGSAKVLNFGGAHRVDGRVIVDITTIEVASNDERFLIKTQFSDDNFAASIVGGTALDVGVLEVTKDEVDTLVGRYELPFTNNINGVNYQYMRLWTEVQGAVATGINYVADATLAVR